MLKIKAILYNWATTERVRGDFLRPKQICLADSTHQAVTSSQISGLHLCHLGLF